MPRWAWYFIGALVAALLAIYLSPVFPAPLSAILYWLLWVIALIAVILGVVDLIGWFRGRPIRA